MKARIWLAIAATLIITASSCGYSGQQASYNPYGADIRSMPVLDRPNRPGHVVGNSLRGFTGQ